MTMTNKWLRKYYIKIKSTKSPASGADTVIIPRLMSHVGRVDQVVCAFISAFLAIGEVEVPVLVC
jgi:hypothetical protein